MALFGKYHVAVWDGSSLQSLIIFLKIYLLQDLQHCEITGCLFVLCKRSLLRLLKIIFVWVSGVFTQPSMYKTAAIALIHFVSARFYFSNENLFEQSKHGHVFITWFHAKHTLQLGMLLLWANLVEIELVSGDGSSLADTTLKFFPP